MKLLELFKDIRNCFKRKSELEGIEGTKIYDMNLKMKHNIYEESIYSTYAKRFRTLHVYLKYYFIKPVFLIYNFCFNRFLKKEIPDKEWNVNLVILNESIDNGIKIWKQTYLPQFWHGKVPTDEELKTQMINSQGFYLYSNLTKNTLNTIYLDDTAYRELINIIMFEMTIRMNKYYGSVATHLSYTHTDKLDAYAIYARDYNVVGNIIKIYESQNIKVKEVDKIS